MEDNALEPTVRALPALAPEPVPGGVHRKAAGGEGGRGRPLNGNPGTVKSPAEGIPLWIAKLKAERYSERTVHMYQYLVRRYLKQNPTNHRKGNEPLGCAMR